MRKQTGLLFILLIVLGLMVFTTWKAYAGQIGVQTGAPVEICRGGSDAGDGKPAVEWCKWRQGPFQASCYKPETCNDGSVPQNPNSSSNGIAGYFNSSRGQNSPPSSRLDKGIGEQQETTWRRVLSQTVSLLMLVIALGGIAFSLRKLLRPARAPRGRFTWAVTYPRAIGYAAFAVFSLMGALWVTQSSWISTGRVRAAPQQRARTTSKLMPSNLDSGTPHSFSVNEPQFGTAFQVGGKGVLQIGGTAVDKQGNTYVAGAFYGTVTFNTGESPTTLTNTEDFDVFIAKYDSANRPLWARMANGAKGLTQVDPETGYEEHYSLDGALSLAIDAQGNAYVGGGFVKSLAFKDGGGNTVATLGDSNDDINFEAFVAKYDATGTLVWAHGGESGAVADPEAEEDLDSGINGITDIVVDKAGNPYVAGAFSGTNFLGHAITNNGQRDIVLSRLNPATGNPIWVSTPGSAGIDAGKGLAVDDNSNVYLIGDVGSTITFPTQPQPTTLTVDDDFGDSFLAKYDRNGQVLWAKQIGGEQPIEGVHIAATGAGDVYLTGAFAVEATFDSITVADPSEYLVVSGFLAKFDTTGNAQWARIFGHYNNDGTEGFTFGIRVAVDNAGTPYVLGTFDNEVTFNFESSAEKQSLTSTGREDSFIAHYDAAGNYRWAKPLRESEDTDFSISGESVPVEAFPLRIVHNEANDSLTVTSYFLGTVVLDNLTLDSGSNIHSYVATLPLAQNTPSVQFGTSSYSVRENDSNIAITVTRIGDTSGAATVDYTTSDQSGTTPCQTNNTGAASDRCDYGTIAGTLRFAAGEAQKTIPLLLVDDVYVEGPELLSIKLSNPQGASLGAIATATITITDNDTLGATQNPIDSLDFFIRQQYIDFLGREPETAGFNFWKARMTTSCPPGETCDRVDTAFRFFQSQEFKERGYFVYLFYNASLGRPPLYSEWLLDVSKLNGPKTVAEQEAAKETFINDFISRQEFTNLYNGAQTGETFVGALIQKSGVNPAARQQLINNYQTTGRAKTLRAFLETEEVQTAFIDRAFVSMLYFGFLRREPEPGGFSFWMQKLNETNKDYKFLIKGFIQSDEYRFRYAPMPQTP